MESFAKPSTRDGVLFGIALLALALMAFVYAFQWKLLCEPINNYVSDKTGPGRDANCAQLMRKVAAAEREAKRSAKPTVIQTPTLDQ